MPGPEWHAPRSLDEALALRARLGLEAPVVAGGTFIGILTAMRMLQPEAFLALRWVPGLDRIELIDGELHLGALVTHRSVERSPQAAAGWRVLIDTFRTVASPRIRNVATVGGVLADADYASDPPAVLSALGARVRLRGPAGEREVAVRDLILDHYETAIGEDELLLETIVPAAPRHASYTKFRTRSSEDRPCVGVAVVAESDDGGRCRDLRVVIGAVAARPQYLPDVCALAENETLGAELGREIGERYAAGVEAVSDLRGSEPYRRRIIGVLIRRAIEQMAQAA